MWVVISGQMCVRKEGRKGEVYREKDGWKKRGRKEGEKIHI